METSIETLIGVFIFLLVITIAISNVLIYIGSSEENKAQKILLEYAKRIANKVKENLNCNTDPSYYGINSKISIYIEIRKFDYDGELRVSLFCVNGIKAIDFAYRSEILSSYLNSSLYVIIVRVYGTP